MEANSTDARQVISFAYNWNNKLNCKCFTTFRRHNPNRYVKGRLYDISVKNKVIGYVQLVDIRTIELSKVNDFIAHLDTGYSVEGFNDIMHKMYKDIKDSDKFDLVLLKWTNKV